MLFRSNVLKLDPVLVDGTASLAEEKVPAMFMKILLEVKDYDYYA